MNLAVKQIKLTLSVVWIKADGSAAASKQLATGSQHPEAAQHPKKWHKSLSVYLPYRVLRSSCCDWKLTGNWTGLQLIRLDCSRSRSSLRKLSVASRSFSEKIEQLERLVQPVERLTFGCSNWSTAAQLQLDLKL
jgi:hypothetical protein